MVSQGCGATQGASTARTTMVPTMSSPALSWSGHGLATLPALTSSDAAAIADSRVEPRVQQVGCKIGERIDCRNDQNGRLQRWDVARLHGKHQQAPEAWVSENGLYHDDAAHQPADVQCEHGDGREQ